MPIRGEVGRTDSRPSRSVLPQEEAYWVGRRTPASGEGGRIAAPMSPATGSSPSSRQGEWVVPTIHRLPTGRATRMQ